MRRKWIWLLVGWLMILGVVACGRAVSSLSLGAAPTAPPDTPVAKTVVSTATAEPAGTPTPLWTAVPTIPIPSDTTLQKLVIRAKEDLAKRLSIEVDQIGLIEAKAVEWSDTSLGCPKPGMMYAQVITPGYRVVPSSPFPSCPWPLMAYNPESHECLLTDRRHRNKTESLGIPVV